MCQAIHIRYHNHNIEKIKGNYNVGNWIDLRAAETVEMKAGDYKVISLGISAKLPDRYEAHIAPRSSTFRNFGILQANGVGVIDTSYCGDNDVWGFPAVAMRDTVIHEGDRICQFRIMKSMKPLAIIEVDHLDSKDRGGFGSTGVK